MQHVNKLVYKYVFTVCTLYNIRSMHVFMCVWMYMYVHVCNEACIKCIFMLCLLFPVVDAM